MEKLWEKRWTVQDFIDNSDNWSLAGDVALLNTLKSFSENMLEKCSNINNNLKSLNKNLAETDLKLNLAQNHFRRLRNSQFIESRVYEDDDETLSKEKKTEEGSKIDQNECLRQAIEQGLKTIDQYFDKIDVPISDSEDDNDLPNYILKPKDLYLDRPLPYVIGSDEWYQKPHVGLEFSSESENEDKSEKFSESDSESDLPTADNSNPIKYSDTSSEMDITYNSENPPINQMIHPTAATTSSNDQIPSNFAQQLAAKLDEEINRRPIQKVPQYNNLFDDEPPPFDNEEKGLFSSQGGLFDDDGDDETDESSMKNDNKPKFDLFDDKDDDGEIFQQTKSYLAPINTNPPLFSEEPPVLEGERSKKIPIGGKKIFSDVDLFSKLPQNKLQPTNIKGQVKRNDTNKPKINLFNDDDDNLFNDDQFADVAVKNNFKSNLFDTNDLFVDSSPERSINSTQKTSVDLFGSTPPPIDNNFDNKSDGGESVVDPYEDEFSTINSTNQSKVFDNSATNLRNVSLFDDRPPKDDLFEEENDEFSHDSLFPERKLNVNDKSLNDDLFNTSNEPDEKLTTAKMSIFDDPPFDDLFDNEISTAKKTSIFNDERNFDDLFDDGIKQPEKQSNKNKNNISIFSDEPSHDDNTQITEEKPSETQSVFDEIISEQDCEGNSSSIKPKSPVQVSSGDLFNDSINKQQNFDESEEIVSKPPKKVEGSPKKLNLSLNINVGALMPGAAPPTFFKSQNRQELRQTDVETPTKEKVELLYSVTKERPRVPLNRRPSTRKGRKAALKQSTSDFQLNLERNPQIQSDLIDQSVQIINQDEQQEFPKLNDDDDNDTLRNNKSNNDEHDIFDELFEKIKQTNTKLSTNIDEKLTTIQSKMENDFIKNQTIKPISLFDNDDDDDDDEDGLFVTGTTKKNLPTTMNKSLFEDDDDDDDIFGNSSSTNASKSIGKIDNRDKKPAKTSTIRKLENIKPEDDPLSNF